MTPFRTSVLFLAAIVLALSCSDAAAQFGLFKKKKKDEPSPSAEYSEKDLETLAEIAQRPEVVERIEKEWSALRESDMEKAYLVNRSTGRRLKLAGGEGAAEDLLDDYGTLYDNPILQNYVNSVGQRLVPADSTNLYAFKLLLDPVPRAETLTTGTIYISTGLIALLDNEAQLAYVLGHEIGHLESSHHYKALRQTILEEVLWEEKEESAAKKRALFRLATTVGGALIGGYASHGRGLGTLGGAAGGYIAGGLVGNLVFRNRFHRTDWPTINEDEADAVGVDLMLKQAYDAREVPRAYARLEGLVARDARLGLGFMGNPSRVKERVQNIEKLLSGELREELDRLLDAGAIGSTPNFSLLMAALKRDNAVIALDYDLFPMAKANLEDALALRSNDPRTHYYLGKVYALTGRDPEEKQKAIDHYLRAIQYDAERGSYPEPHLQKALFLIDENSPANQKEIQQELKTYIRLYQRQHAGGLPPNMHIIYDYFLLSGESDYYVPPVTNISTENVEPISIKGGREKR